MRRCLVILAGVLVSAFAWLSMSMQSGVNTGTASGPLNSTNFLCNEGRIICVSQPVAHSLISNPFSIELQVNSPDDIEVDWEIEDSTGQVLESSSTYDYPNFYMPTRNSTRDSSPTKTLRILDFIFGPAQSESGTLILSPSRYTVAAGKTDLPGLKIPVRLTTATTLLTTLEPTDPEARETAVIEWVESEDHPEFDPKLKLLPHHVTVMRVDPGAIIGATAEAVLRSHVEQSSPFHVTDWRQEGDTAHVGTIGGGWAGVTYYLTGVDYLIRESVLNLAGIRRVIFE